MNADDFETRDEMLHWVSHLAAQIASGVLAAHGLGPISQADLAKSSVNLAYAIIFETMQAVEEGAEQAASPKGVA